MRFFRWMEAQASRSALLIAVGGVVLGTRAGLYAVGLQFYDRELDRFMPFLEPDLLRGDLLRSLWYLHLKPPGMNFGVGSVLQLAGDASTAVFAVAYVGLGVVLAISLADLLRQLNVPVAATAVVAIGFALRPSVLLFETFLYHTYPAAALLAATVACFGRALSSGRTRWWALCFGLGAALCYTRSLFHLVWLLGLVGGVLGLRWGWRRRLLRTAALPVTAVVGLYAKNLLLFGVFGASSWLGLSLGKGTVHNLPAATEQAWIEQGRLHPVAQVDPFAGPEAYQPHVDGPPPTGIPALDQRRKRSGAPNYNHRIFPAASDAQLANALTTIRHRPGLYASEVLRNVGHWLSPTATWHPLGPDGSPFRPNRALLGEYERAVRAVLYPVDGSDAFGITLLIPLLVVAGTWTGVRAVRRGRVAEGGLRLGLAGTIFYVGVVSCLVEAGPELSRFRFVTDALSIALAAALLARWRSSGGA